MAFRRRYKAPARSYRRRSFRRKFRRYRRRGVRGPGANLRRGGRLGIEKIKNEGVRSGLAHLIGLRDKAGIAANTILQGDAGIMRNLRKLETLLGEGRAGEVIRQIQEGQFNPEYKFNLDAEQMKVKDQIQAMFEQTRQEMERITGKPVKQIPNYFPSMFFGPFAVELRDANGRLVAFITEKNKKAVESAAKEVIADMASKGEELTASPAKYRKELQSEAFRNRGGLAPYFESMMDLLGSEDPLVQKAQQSVQNLVAKRAMDTKKFSQRFERKAGVMGAMGERGWKSAKENYRDAKDVLENYVRAFEDWKANQSPSWLFLTKVRTVLMVLAGSPWSSTIRSSALPTVSGLSGVPLRADSSTNFLSLQQQASIRSLLTMCCNQLRKHSRRLRKMLPMTLLKSFLVSKFLLNRTAHRSLCRWFRLTSSSPMLRLERSLTRLSLLACRNTPANINSSYNRLRTLRLDVSEQHLLKWVE